MKRSILTLALGAALCASLPAVAAPDEPVFGREMMSVEERNEFRERMRAAKSDTEREKLRAEHHQKMLERARERGVTLPAEPPALRRRQGMGSGMGPGAGAGRPQGGSGGGGGR